MSCSRPANIRVPFALILINAQVLIEFGANFSDGRPRGSYSQRLLAVESAIH